MVLVKQEDRGGEEAVSVWIPIADIQFNPKNPRTRKNKGFEEEYMARLRKGIRVDGLNYPLMVFDEGGSRYRLVGGERRLRSIHWLIESDKNALKNGLARVLCYNQRSKKQEPAIECFKKIECKITDCPNDREARRKAIQDNTLAEHLTDYELLLQVEELERDGFSRAEQAETLGVSEAHVSQSHGLLESNPKILEYLENGLLTRTSAITFLSVPDDKVVEVLDLAAQLTWEDGNKKETAAQKVKEDALKVIEKENDRVTLSTFTGDKTTQRKARRSIARAGKDIDKADKQIAAAKDKKKNKKMTVDTILTAAKQVDGAGDDLKRPQSMKQLRVEYRNIADLLAKEGAIARPDTGAEYSREEAQIVYDTLGWVLSENKEAKSALDVLSPVKKKAKKAG